MFAGAGHGVPGIHGGVGDTVGVGAGVAGDADGVALGTRVRERVVDGEDDGPASLLEPQATSSEASVRQAQRTAARLDRQTRAAERGLAAIAGVVCRRRDMAETIRAGIARYSTGNNARGRKYGIAPAASPGPLFAAAHGKTPEIT